MKHLTLIAFGALLLAGCSGLAQRSSQAVAGTDRVAGSLVRQVGQNAPDFIATPAPTSVHEDGIWLGKKLVKLPPPALPPVFREPATFDRTVYSLNELAERLTLRSGVPIKVSADAQALVARGGTLPPVAAGASTPGASPLPLGPPGVPLAPGSVAPAGTQRARAEGIHLQQDGGTFQGLLDMATARFGISWKYADGSIIFYHTDSRTFQIHALPGESTFSATVSSGASSSSGGSGGSGGGAAPAASGGAGGGGGDSGGVNSNNQQNTVVNSQLTIYGNLEKAVSALLSPYGKVVSSPATGSITVVDTPDVLNRVQAFIDRENIVMSRQIAINVTVLAVTLTDSDSYGIDWNLVYSTLLHNYGISNTLAQDPNSVSFSAGVLSTSNSRLAGSKLMIQALSEQGKVRRQTSATVVTLNNQPVPVQVARQTSYLKSSQSTVTALVGTTTTLTPGVVTSGVNMSILPHILDNGTLMLQFSTDISTLNAIRTVSSSGDVNSTNSSTLETPEIDTRNFLQRVAMKSNETLIVSGFEQSEDNLTESGVGKAQMTLLGGGRQVQASKEIIVVLITPTAMAAL